jgi:hypothetical protein
MQSVDDIIKINVGVHSNRKRLCIHWFIGAIVKFGNSIISPE